MTAIKTAAYFLISLAFNIYIYILLLRLFMQKMGANWYNPVTQLIVKVTDPVVKPLRRFLPGFKGFDLAIIVLCICFQLIALVILMWIQFGVILGILGLIVVAIAELGMKVVNVFFYATIIVAIASWFPNLQRNPAVEIVALLTAPLMRIAHRYIPPISGFDFSPIVIIIFCILINILIFVPLSQFGLRLAVS